MTGRYGQTRTGRTEYHLLLSQGDIVHLGFSGQHASPDWMVRCLNRGSIANRQVTAADPQTVQADFISYVR